MLLVCLLLGLQEEVIQRSDPLRSQYQEAVELCRAAEELLERDPDAAAAKLTELLEKHGQLSKIERRLRIKVFADDAGSPYNFFPYQFRGRARLAKDPEAAVRDFERSVALGAAASKPLLQQARLAWWAALRPALERDPRAVDKARALLRELPEPDVAEAVAWVGDQLRPVEKRIQNLRRADAADRARAQQDAAWCRRSERLLENLAAAADLLAMIRAAAAKADEIAGFRGSFRLKILATPWAEVTRLSREGKEVPLPVRETPFVVPTDLEIGDYEIVLVHPRLGKQSHKIASRDLQEGKTILLVADLEAKTITLRLSP